MAERAYIWLVWRNHRAFTLFSMLFIGLLQFLIPYLVSTFDTNAIFSAVLTQLPEMMRGFMQESIFGIFTMDGAAAFGFNHPLVLALLVISAVSVPVSQVTREVESGTLELLLAHPLKRRNLIASLWVAGCLMLLLIILGGLIGSLGALYIYHELTPLVFQRVLLIGVNLWLLILLIFSYTLLIAVSGKPGLKAGNIGAVVTLVFYLVFFLSQIWEKIQFTRTFNIFNYFEPQKLIAGQADFILDAVVLGTLIVTCFVLSAWQFNRRDIP